MQIKFRCFFLLFFCFRPEEGSATPAEKQNDEKILGAEDEKPVGVTGTLTCCLTDNNLIL